MDILNFEKDDINEIYNETNSRQIVISVEQIGRRKLTHINGWNLPTNDLLNHLKEFKKKNGCNGNIKNNELQVQGDHKDTFKDYLIKNGVKEDIIYIKG
jgi:translation initiation factor 1 (eIF-1/SUI1)